MRTRAAHVKKRLMWLLENERIRGKPLTLAYKIASWEFIRFIGRPIVAEMGGDLRIVSYPSEGYSRVLHYFQFNKPFIARFYERFLEEGMVYIDCGANIGTYSLVAARKVGPSGAVHAFEPQPDIFHRLLVNIHLNRLENIHAYRLAVGDSVGAAEMVQLQDHVASYLRPKTEQSGGATFCNITTLDDFFSASPVHRADFLKIDVEGFELRALQGARKFIHRHRPTMVQFEYYPTYPLLPKNEWPTLDAFRQFFCDMDYDGFFCVNRRTGLLERLIEDNPQDNDIFCIGKDIAENRKRNLFA